jgi:hypothetical protein
MQYVRFERARDRVTMPKPVYGVQVKFCAVQMGGEWRTAGQAVSRWGWVSKGCPSTSLRPSHHFCKLDGLRFYFFRRKVCSSVAGGRRRGLDLLARAPSSHIVSVSRCSSPTLPIGVEHSHFPWNAAIWTKQISSNRSSHHYCNSVY